VFKQFEPVDDDVPIPPGDVIISMTRFQNEGDRLSRSAIAGLFDAGREEEDGTPGQVGTFILLLWSEHILPSCYTEDEPIN